MQPSLTVRFLGALALAACLPPCQAAPARSDAYYRALEIAAPSGPPRRYVAGDNLDGWFEGRTGAYDGGGYRMHETVVLVGYATYADGGRLEREGAAARERILPYGHRVAYPGGREEHMALLSGRRAVAMRAGAASPALLAVAPLLAPAEGGWRVVRDGQAVVASPLAPQPGGVPQYAAFAADGPFVLETGRGSTPGPVAAADAASPFADAPRLRSLRPVRRFTVVAAFAATPEQAVREALALARTDAIAAERAARRVRQAGSSLRTGDAAYDRAVEWAKHAADLFVVEQFGKGIWAGLPWFRDNWGRDTFIALPGTLLVNGRFAEARAVLDNFARYQKLDDPASPEYGRIPNRVAAGNSIIYNTVDGTPWLLREALEYIRYTGDRDYARRMVPVARAYFAGALRHHAGADGLLGHDDADTWMDARIEGRQAWSARGPRAVEIQALWHTALLAGADMAEIAGGYDDAQRWRELAAKAQAAFLARFWDGATMADRLRADGSRDLKVRPNQLMLTSIPFSGFMPHDVQARVTRNAVSQLLYPHGIASLAASDPYFHPLHVNDAYHHKDAAYHQGTVWGWNAGFTVTALARFGYQDLAYRLARNLGAQMTELDTLGSMSELVDALPGPGGAIKPSGAYAQSWSVAEYARNAYQDFVGFRPDLLRGALAFRPAPPAAWRTMRATLPYGQGERVRVTYRKIRGGERWRYVIDGRTARRIEADLLLADGSRALAAFDARPGVPVTLELINGKARLDGRPVALRTSMASQRALIGKLDFLPVRRYDPARAGEDFPMLRGKDVLKGIVERNEYR